MAFPDGTDFVMSWAPPQGKVYIVFALTLGPLRDAGGVEVTTSNFGFWHSSSQMKMHWDPGVPSIYKYEYPHWLEIEENDPVILRIVNSYGAILYMDMSLWILETTKEDYLEIKRFLKGIWNYYSALGSMTVEEIAGGLKLLPGGA